MPQRAKSHLGRPVRRSRQPAHLIAHAVHATAQDAGMEPEPEKRVRDYAEARLELYARLAWLHEYSVVYELEAQNNGAAAAVEHHQSNYRRLQMGAGNDDARKQSMLRISQDYERLLREKDVHYIPFSQAIKSAVWVVDQVLSTATWDKQGQAHRRTGVRHGVDNRRGCGVSHAL